MCCRNIWFIIKFGTYVSQQDLLQPKVTVIEMVWAIQWQVCTNPKGSRRLRLPEFLDSQYMKVVRLLFLHTSHLYPPEDIPGTISVRGWVDSRAILQQEGLSQWKMLTSPSGIKPTTLLLVVLCLNQLYHCISSAIEISSLKLVFRISSFIPFPPDNGQ